MPLLKEKIELNIEEAELGLQKQLGLFPPFIKWLLIVAAIGIIPAYYIAKAASHNYWQKAWNNFVIDAKPSFTNPHPPKVSNILLTSAGTGYSAFATVENENLDLFLNDTTYTLTVYNSQNQIIYTATDNFFLLPGKSTYLVMPKFQTSEQPSSANISFPQNLNWQKRLSIPEVSLVTGIPKFYNQVDPLTFVVEDSVVNNSPYNLQSVKLTFLLYDKSKNIIGTSQRTEFTLAPYERRSFKQLWPNTYTEDVTDVKIAAETNPLRLGNISLPTNPGGDASDLSRPNSTNQPY